MKIFVCPFSISLSLYIIITMTHKELSIVSFTAILELVSVHRALINRPYKKETSRENVN